MDDFLINAIAAATALALIAGPLGVFVVWRRMAYFGETLAHSALLGASIGLLFELNLPLTVVVLALTVAALLLWLQRKRSLASDTLLGILAHSTLSLGLVIIAFQENVQIDVMSYLLGDILAVNEADLLRIWVTTISALVILGFIWKSLLSITVHEELARVEGIQVERIKLIFMLLIALVVAVAMQIVGVLLITSMMIIPAASAKNFSSTPEQMTLWAIVFGIFAVGLGLTLSWFVDTPAGPSIVVAASGLFILSHCCGTRQQ